MFVSPHIKGSGRLVFFFGLILLCLGFQQKQKSKEFQWNKSEKPVVWQINDYVVYLMQQKIASSHEELTLNPSLTWYYQTLDVRGGFASITGALEGWKEFVLFRRSDGTDMIGEMTVGCGPACDYTFKFYGGVNENIQPIEINQLIPIQLLEDKRMAIWDSILTKYPTEYPEDFQYRYLFPQKGTDMTVNMILGADEIEIPCALLGWNGKTFYLKSFLDDFSD